MKVSLLNEKILFQKSTVVSDAIDNRKNAWEDYYSCFATIGGESGNEKSEAGQIVDGASITFTVRYCIQLVDIVSTGFRSAPGGARFQQVQVLNPPGSGKDIAEGKGVHREVESEGSWMWGTY